MTPGCVLCDRQSLLIYPVRYAVACPRGAAKAPALSGNFKIDSRAPQSVASAKYTLRALRAGYLYTYDEKRRLLHAYIVLPSGIMGRFTPGMLPPPPNMVKALANGCATEIDLPSLSRCVDVAHTPGVDEATNLWIGWSNVTWTKSLVQKMLDDAKWRKQHMQCINIPSLLAGGVADAGEFKTSRANIAHFEMNAQALKDAFDFSNTPTDEESNLYGLADGIAHAMDQTPNKKGFVVAVNDPVGITNDLAELTVPSPANGFDAEIYWKYMSAQLLEGAEAGIRGRAEAMTQMAYGVSKTLADATVVNTAAHAEAAPDPIGLYNFVRSWIKTGSADQAANIEQQKVDDVSATARAASDQAWDEASLQMGPDGKPVIGPDGKPVSLIDTGARDRFVQHEYPQALDAFKPKWRPLVDAHADWLKSQLLADWMAGNHDTKDLRSGYAYSESCAQAIGKAAGTDACQKVLEDWLSGPALDDRKLYTRALMFNHEELIKAANAQVRGSDIQYENILNIYKDAFARVEKAGDASGLRDRLVVTTANTVVNVLAKGGKGAATAFVTMRLALHAGVRIRAANITPIEMQKWILDQGKALGLKLEGNRVQRRATAAKISKAVLQAASPSNPAVFQYEIDTDAWIKAGTIDANDIKIIKLPGVETTRRWLSSGSSVDFNLGIATAIFQLAAVAFAWKDYANSDHFNNDENLLKFGGSVVAIVGNLVEKVSETVAKVPNHPLSAFLAKHWATSWLDHEKAEKAVMLGKAAGAAVGIVLAGYDLFKNLPESFKSKDYVLTALYGVSGTLGVYLSLSPYLSAIPLIASWLPPVWVIFIASIFVGLIIAHFKPSAINSWIPRSRFGKGERYHSLDEELKAYNSALEG